MSAWNPSVFGRSTISSSSTLRLQLCMPPQQISPSAASRSPKSSAMSHAWRNVSAIFFVLPAGILRPLGRARRRVDADDAVLPDAEIAQLLGDRAGLLHLRHEVASGPRRCPSPSRRRSAATPARRPSRPRSPWREPCRPAPSSRRRSRRCSCADRRGTDRRRRTSRRPPRRRRSGRASCRDRSAARRRDRPCRPGRATWRCAASDTCACVLMVSWTYVFFLRSGSLSGLPGTEVLQQHERIGRAVVLDAHALARGRGRDEDLVFGHLAEADHRGRRHAHAVHRAVALRENHAVGFGVA